MAASSGSAGPPEPATPSGDRERPGRLDRSLRLVERAGNALPDPVLLFVWLSLLLAVLSAVLGALGLRTVVPGTGEPVVVRTLLSGDGLRFALTSVVDNFVEFPPLGIIITAMLGIAVADRSGLLPALLRVTVLRAPRRLLTPALCVTGVSGSVASDAAFVVLVPLGALVFRSVGRSPVVGAVAAFVSVGAGFGASVFLTSQDVVLSGITTQAATLIDPTAEITPLANYFFTPVSAIVVGLAAAWVIDRVVEPRFATPADGSDDGGGGTGGGTGGGGEDEDGELSTRVDASEVRGLVVAGVTFVVYLGLCALAWLPPGAPLRSPDGGGLVPSPFISGIVPILLLGFLLCGVAYGVAAGSVTRPVDVVPMMRDGVRDLAPIVVLFFVIAQFLAWFEWTGIGRWLAVTGAEALRALGAPTPVLLVLTMVLVFLLGLLLTSGSAQWALMAPVLVPMLLLVGVEAAEVQAAFRVADSVSNVLTPMSPYFGLTLGVLQQYRRGAGIGTLTAMTLPPAAVMFAVWALLLLGYVLLGIPLGV